MKLTVCDFCRKPTDSIHIPHVGKIVLRTIRDNRWKTEDICITCLFKFLKKEMEKNETKQNDLKLRKSKHDCKSNDR